MNHCVNSEAPLDIDVSDNSKCGSTLMNLMLIHKYTVRFA